MSPLSFIIDVYFSEHILLLCENILGDWDRHRLFAFQPTLRASCSRCDFNTANAKLLKSRRKLSQNDRVQM